MSCFTFFFYTLISEQCLLPLLIPLLLPLLLPLLPLLLLLLLVDVRFANTANRIVHSRRFFPRRGRWTIG